MFATLLQLMPEPNVQKLKILMLLPTRTSPKIDILLPRRMTLLTDSEEPIFRQSRIETSLPNVVFPKQLKPEPKVTNERIEKLLPTMQLLKMERPSLMKVRPNTLMPEPIRAPPLNDKVDPHEAKFSTLNDAPSLELDLSDMELPM
jgi:hypothetical protein